MRAIRSSRVRRALPLVAAMALVMACSSDSVTGPSTRQNATLILRFDSLMNATSGDRPGIYSDIAQMLAEGAPVNTGTITVNGTTERMNMAGQFLVGMSNGVPVDSQYVLAAWKGNGSDSVIVFIQSGGTVVSFSAFGATSGEDFGGTASVVQGPLGASCTPFTAPGDIFIPASISCQAETATDTFSIVLGGGIEVSVSNQPIAGIHAEVEAAPPPC